MSDVLGLDRQMHEAYHLLLRDCARTAAVISDRLGISRAKADDILARLTAAGLVEHAPDDPRRLLPVDPRRGLAPLIARRQAQLAAQQHVVSRSKEAIAALTAEFTTVRHDGGHPQPSGSAAPTTAAASSLPGPRSNPAAVPEPASRSRPDVPSTAAHQSESASPSSDQARSFASNSSLRTRIDDMLAASRSAVMCFVADRASAIALDVSGSAVEKAIDRGVSIRAVYSRSTLGAEAVRAHARWLVSLGGSARTVATLPPPMMVVDRAAALIPADVSSTGVSVVRSRTLAAALAFLFDQVWGGAQVAAAAPSGEAGDEPSPQERDLLRLLGTGLTDASAARQLGVSLRTVRRMMAELMARLHARSRFEAGIRAAERGWVGPTAMPLRRPLGPRHQSPAGPGDQRLTAGQASPGQLGRAPARS